VSARPQYRRVAITGMGAMTSLGGTIPSLWGAILAGRSGVSYIKQFDSGLFPVSIGGEIDLEAMRDPELDGQFPGCGRAAHFGSWAAGRAWQDAQFASGALDESRAGVCIGASTFPVIEDRLDRLGDLLDEQGWNRRKYLELCRSRPHLLAQSDAAFISTVLSQRLQFQGPSTTVQAACASATQAIGHAFHLIRNGDADVMLAGGTDSMVSMMCVTGFTLLGSLSRRWSTPAKASRPFDRTRDGFVLAEGAAMLILEDLNQALNRGATIHAEIVGYGSSCDAYRFTDVHPDGLGASMCMNAALEDAGVEPHEIGYINAHGTSTPLNDRVETIAIRQVFGRHSERLAVSSTKSQLGHLLCAAGAVEALLSVLTLECGSIPATINLENADPDCDLDYVPLKPRQADVRLALSNSFGFGGQNGALVFRRWEKCLSECIPNRPPMARRDSESDEGARLPAPNRDHRGAAGFNRALRSAAKVGTGARVVATGVGIVSSLGLNAPTHFERLCRGESGIRSISGRELEGLPLTCEGRVLDFERREHVPHRMLRKILTNAACYAVAAAGEAICDAGLAAERGILERCGICVGSLGLDQDFNVFADSLRVSLTREKVFDTRLFVEYGMSLIDPLFLVKSLPNSGLCGMAIQFGLRGANLNIMNGPVSGLQSIDAAAAEIRSGNLDCAIAGGYDSLLQLEVAINHLIAGNVRAGERPSSGRNGYALGEGAAFVFLESETHARARGARIYAEITGGGQTHAASHPMTREAGAGGLRAAAQKAMDAAGVETAGIIFGDGFGAPFQDGVEADVLNHLRMKQQGIRFTSAAGALGFCGVASGALSAAHALLGLREALIPPIVNCSDSLPDCAETYIRSQERLPFDRALVWSSDRGFDHVAVILERYEGGAK
jgi:3-oxoacyl-[acyl-carrier-protein] synthase II